MIASRAGVLGSVVCEQSRVAVTSVRGSECPTALREPTTDDEAIVHRSVIHIRSVLYYEHNVHSRVHANNGDVYSSDG